MSDEDKYLKPFNVRKIKARAARRALVVVLFVPYVAMAVFIAICWTPYYVLNNICRAVIVVCKTAWEAWNE